MTRSRVSGQLVLGLAAMPCSRSRSGRFTSRSRRGTSASGTRWRYSAIVRGHAHNYHLGTALLAAVIYQESKFKSNAKSDRGAVGLMQLLPATAKEIAARTGGSKFQVSDLS